MKLFLTVAGLGVLLSGCAGTRLGGFAFETSKADAVALVRESAHAHGFEHGRVPERVTAQLDGNWYSLVTKVQPELTDSRFRKSSVETYDVRRGRVVQRHTGPGGVKDVVRTRDGVTVRYNGVVSTNETARAAAALVADAYTMFLFGPVFFLERSGVVFEKEPERVTIDGNVCLQVRARLRPGFGFSPEDHALLSFDKQSRRLKRVLFTINGLASTQGAEVDVTFGGFNSRGGYIWPTEFFERVRSPLRIPAHRWGALSVEVR
jgi:hypothetical protein